MSNDVEIEVPFKGFGKGLENQINNSIGSTVWRSGGVSNGGADFAFSTTMTVGESFDARGWRAFKYGGLESGTWENVNWDRIYVNGGAGTENIFAKFAGDVQFQGYTSLWFKFGIIDFIEIAYGPGYYLLADDARIGPLWTYMNSKVGQTIPFVVEARS